MNPLSFDQLSAFLLPHALAWATISATLFVPSPICLMKLLFRGSSSLDKILTSVMPSNALSTLSTSLAVRLMMFRSVLSRVLNHVPFLRAFRLCERRNFLVNMSIVYRFSCYNPFQCVRIAVFGANMPFTLCASKVWLNRSILFTSKRFYRDTLIRVIFGNTRRRVISLKCVRETRTCINL